MEAFSAVIRSFIAYLRAHSCRVPRELVGPFLRKLLDIFENEPLSEEEKVLLDLLCNLLEHQSKLSDAGSVGLRASLINVVEVLFANILNQKDLIRKLQVKGDCFTHRIQELQSIVRSMMESENDSLEATPSTPYSQTHMNHPSDFTHVVAHPDPSTSWVVVVAEDQEVPQQIQDRAESVSVGVQCDLIDTTKKSLEDVVADEEAQEAADPFMQEHMRVLMERVEAVCAVVCGDGNK